MLLPQKQHRGLRQLALLQKSLLGNRVTGLMQIPTMMMACCSSDWSTLTSRSVPEEAEPQPARRAYQKRKIWPDQPPIDPEKWSRMSIAEKKEANQALFRKCGYAGNRASLDRMAEYAALAPSTQVWSLTGACVCRCM